MSTYSMSFFKSIPNPLSPRIMKLIFASLLILVITVTVHGEPASNSLQSDVDSPCGSDSLSTSCADNVTKRGVRQNAVARGVRQNAVARGVRQNAVARGVRQNAVARGVRQ